MPALRLDAAVVHVNRADANGSGQILGPDPFFDELFLGAADRRFVTTERIVDTEQFASEGPLQTMCISRLLTDGVVETPRWGPLHRLRSRLPAGRGVPEELRGRGRRRRPVGGLRRAVPRAVPEADYQAATGDAGDVRRQVSPTMPMPIRPETPASPGPSTASSPVPRCSGATAR